MFGNPSARTPIVVGLMERVYPKWCAAHPRLIVTRQSIGPANIRSRLGAADCCDNSRCACRCSVSCGGFGGFGEWWQQWRGFLWILTDHGFATISLFHATTSGCTRTIASAAWESLPILWICYARWLLCSYAQVVGWRQQCSIPYVQGVLRMCERRVHGNQNIVQESCGCDPSCAGHKCRDLGGRACFGKLHLFVVRERPLWCGFWGFIW